jgi:hypothetical protein
VLGWEGALKFLQHNRKKIGQKVYIPAKYSASNKMFDGMSDQHIIAFIKEFGGEEIKFYGPKRMLASERYQLMADDYIERNFTPIMLQEKYNLSEDTVHWFINRLDLRTITER